MSKAVSTTQKQRVEIFIKPDDKPKSSESTPPNLHENLKEATDYDDYDYAAMMI